MSNIHAEQYPTQSNQELARQRLAASRQDVLLYTHLLQASLVVERNNPLRQAVSTHPRLARGVTAVIVILLSIAAGILAPVLVQALNLY